MKLSLRQLAAWAGTTFDGAGEATGYSIDTRTLIPGDLFFALAGERSDGHEWAPAALDKGAAAAVVRRDWQAPSGALEGRLLRVEAPVEALRKMAAAARAQWAGPLVAITGSNGKTTTKDALAALLATRRRVSKTLGNLNNELGLPLTLLRIDDEADAAVVEMGMNHADEIRRMARWARPNVGLVTNVSAAHVGFFDSVEAVAAAKRELIEELPPDGVAVLNADDSRVRRFAESHAGRAVFFGQAPDADYRVDEIDSGADGSSFRLTSPGNAAVRFETRLPGRHNILNIAAAVAAAAVLGFSPDALSDAVSSLEASAMRGQVYERGGIRVIDDCYNANPASMAAALELLAAEPARRKIAVLGEMRELGARSIELHRETAKRAAFADRVVGVGGDARELIAELPSGRAEFFETADEAGERLRAELRPGDLVLFKGSRGVGLEKARDRALAPAEEKGDG